MNVYCVIFELLGDMGYKEWSFWIEINPISVIPLARRNDIDLNMGK